MQILTNSEDPLKGFNQDIIAIMFQKDLSGYYEEDGLEGGKRVVCVCGSLNKRPKWPDRLLVCKDTRKKGEMRNSQEVETVRFCDSLYVGAEVTVKCKQMQVDVTMN